MELYIFLDIDGVLTSFEHPGTDVMPYDFKIDDFHLANFNILVARYNPKIVITSTWRMHDYRLKEIRDCGINYYDVTDIIWSRDRETEILMWQKKYMQPEDWGLIIDDDHVLSKPRQHLIEFKTNVYSGLTVQNIYSIIEMVDANINQKEISREQKD